MQKYDLTENYELEQAEQEIGYFTKEEYIQALIRISHPRHKEAMAIRNKKYFAPDTILDKRQSEDLDRHITSLHLIQD